MFLNKNFILASKSSSRAAILKKNNVVFQQTKPKVNEEELKQKNKNKNNAKKLTEFLAKEKAKSIKKKDTLILGVDTAIYFRGEIINKAKNIKEAKNKILHLSGKKHNIYSSAACYYNNKLVWFKTQKSTVKIRNLSEKEVEKYLKLCGKSVLKSVGCYRVEKEGPNIIENISGDFFNVMGLPLFPFLKFLKKFNIKK
ncbi:MAG: Septum formation protein Maf [Alphaproteobacteria bacterium MarineAlpha5_Bin8]|nr:MAG: Septum formation protein Maf [Alphaproteobacteria bacterium MarineAlpha5_Bin7]PPR48359.1 MAG: Septum formation protein Maf [Alphaproteobacteria bacterium MarineAlpha5_Bin8]PPR54751.1 MAG: Septum formation protein Maf [Alphaproteobacteria bacterium MarineAlpha5_Bin6]|tara:strand:- start:831 stop:1424 length:594 start_codon:yes stop_codon:yes gene_type:complete